MSYISTCLIPNQPSFDEILAGILGGIGRGQRESRRDNFIWERLSDLDSEEIRGTLQEDCNSIDLRIGPPLLAGSHLLRLRIERPGCPGSIRARAQFLLAAHDWLKDCALQGISIVLTEAGTPSHKSNLQQEALLESLKLGSWRRRVTSRCSQKGYQGESEGEERVVVESLSSSEPDSLRQFLFGSGALEQRVLRFEIRASCRARDLLNSFSVSSLQWSLLCDAAVERLVPPALRALSLEMTRVDNEYEVLVIGVENPVGASRGRKEAFMDSVESLRGAMVVDWEEHPLARAEDSIQLEVCLGELNLSLMDLLRLRNGDELRLKLSPSHQCEIRFGGGRVATGTLEFGRGEIGVRIVSVAPFVP